MPPENYVHHVRLASIADSVYARVDHGNPVGYFAEIAVKETPVSDMERVLSDMCPFGGRLLIRTGDGIKPYSADEVGIPQLPWDAVIVGVHADLPGVGGIAECSYTKPGETLEEAMSFEPRAILPVDFLLAASHPNYRGVYGREQQLTDLREELGETG
jgi:hypothetical protein